MKKTIILSATAFAVIGLITVIAISCNKNKSEIEKTTQAQKTNSAVGTASTCNCGSKPNGCPTFKNCVKKFMGSANSRNFTINWTSCTACGNTLPPPSTGLVCYTGSCSELYVQFNDLPPCLQNCYTVPFCQKVTQVVCQGVSFPVFRPVKNRKTNRSFTNFKLTDLLYSIPFNFTERLPLILITVTKASRIR